jgi:two-component system response regulator (stage 0 sporulation protein A)
MYTVEEKLDLVMRYTTTEDNQARSKLKRQIADALATGGSPAHKSADMHDVILDVLRDIGIQSNLLGYDYLVTAIELVYMNRTLLHAMTKKLYPEIAKMYTSTASRVERAMRHAVEVAFDYNACVNVERIFGNIVNPSTGKIANGQFIAACVMEVERRLKAMIPMPDEFKGAV